MPDGTGIYGTGIYLFKVAFPDTPTGPVYRRRKYIG
jgi:hypothetical protein